MTQCFSYGSPSWITELADFTRADDLESPEKAAQLASVLRLHPDRWRAMAYLKVKGGSRFLRRQFFGQLVAADRLNLGAPRVCPGCLRETRVWWGIWDLAIVSVCPGHRCKLTSTCPCCGNQLVWRRPGVEICPCGFDLRKIESAEAESNLIAVNARVYQSAGFPIGVGQFDLVSGCAPKWVDRMLA